MANKIKIVSDGTPGGTEVYAGNTKITGISKITIPPIVPQKLLEVSITFLQPELDLIAELADSGKIDG